MLYDSIKKEAGGLGHANHESLKSAYSNHDNSIMKDDATSMVMTGQGDTALSMTLTSAGIKHFYAVSIKRGPKNIDGSSFPDVGSVDLSYSNAPELGGITPEGETAPGSETGSTIVSSGLGPNVNIHPISSISERRMVDPGYTNPVNLGSPHAASATKSPDAAKHDSVSIPPGIEGEYQHVPG